MIKKPTAILHQHNHMCFGANFRILETTCALIHASRHVLVKQTEKLMFSPNLILGFKYLIKVSLSKIAVALYK